jgi:hypothetical protein
MGSNDRPEHDLAHLTPLEFAVFYALEGRQNATAEQIRRELPWPSDAKDVRGALLRLEERLLVAHSIAGGQIFYVSRAHTERLAAASPSRDDGSPSKPNLI